MANTHRNSTTETELAATLPRVLAAALQGTGWRVASLRRNQRLNHGLIADAVVRLRSGSAQAMLVVEVSTNPRLTPARERALLLQYVLAESSGRGAPAIAFVVPRVTPPLANLLRDLDVGYVDWAGACRLQWPGLVVERAGSVSPAAKSPRASALDAAQVLGPRAPRRHRVLRALLSWPGRRWHQTELAEEAGASVFTVHGVVQCLLAEHLADEAGRGPEKVMFLRDPGELLDAWVPFWRGTWRAHQRAAALFHGLAGGQDAVRDRLGAAASRVHARVGLTLSAGANCYGPYLRDDTTHAYVLGDIDALVQAADLEPVASGANVVLFPTTEEGLLYLTDDLRRRAGIAALAVAAPVCPAQLYLDMKTAGGRLAEQADRLREEFLDDGS
jgi:hypothetical protein